MADVKVFGAWFSPFSRRAEMALKMKGVEYEYVEEDLSNKSNLLIEYNPVHKKVPVLVHKGMPISESLVIVEYIDETFEGPSILPKDSYERAMARFWAKFIDEKCSVAMWKACSSTTGEEREKLKEESIQHLKFLDSELKGKKFFGGDAIGYVDIAANFIGYWFVLLSKLSGIEILTEENHPNLCRWIDSYVNEDLVKENVPDKDKMTALFLKLSQPPVGNEYRPKVE